MNFLTMYTDVAQSLSLDITDSTDLANLKRWINQAYKDVQEAYDWQWRYKWGIVQTVAVYTTGTVTVTEGSRTVTGSGTTFTSAMVGRYFKLNNQEETYKIISYTSGTSITIDVPFVETTTSGASYTIFKVFHDLNTDVASEDDIIYMENESWDKKMLKVGMNNAKSIIQWASEDSSPSKYSVSSLNRTASTYNTGTVSGTLATRTLTGSGTSWLDNVRPGDLVTISTDTYNVESIESDTSLTLVQKIATAASTSAYTITRNRVLQISFNGSPTHIENIRYLYLKATYDLGYTTDEFEMPDKYNHLIKLKAIAYGYGALDDGRETQALQIYGVNLQKAIQEVVNGGNEPSQMTWIR